MAATALEERELLVELIAHYHDRPDAFAEDMFEVRLDDWQVEALLGLNEEGFVSIRACHGPGKSAVMAWTAFWFMGTRMPARIPCTAPTSHQLRDVLWAEMAKWHQRMSPVLRDCYRITGERMEWVPNPKETFAVARTARPETPEALQGFHGENLLFLIDEASGVHEKIYEVGEGSLSEENAKILLAANPTRTSGYFYDTHNSMRALWKTIKVGYQDSSRVSEKYVDRMAQKYGRDSNVFRVRCLGEFPTADDDAVISLELAEQAAERDVTLVGEAVWGGDVARFGDDRTTLCKRQNNGLIEPPQEKRNLSVTQVAGWYMREYDDTVEHLKPAAIYIDVIGIGAGVVDIMADQGYPVKGVNVSESAALRNRFHRLRDELWWLAREWFEGLACSLPPGCDELIGELVVPRYRLLDNGKIQVEPKSAPGQQADTGRGGRWGVKQRMGWSPDLADCFIHTFMHRWARTRVQRASNERGYSRRRKGSQTSAPNLDWVV